MPMKLFYPAFPSATLFLFTFRCEIDARIFQLTCCYRVCLPLLVVCYSIQNPIIGNLIVVIIQY
jgi:hypothetical protein